MKKRNKIITTSISALIVAVLAIMAFVRGPLQVWLYAAAFTIFTVVVAISVIRAHKQRQQYVRHKPCREQQVAFEIPELGGTTDAVLMQHVNHRISTHLQATYPDITWEWKSEAPEKAVMNGGEVRIRLFGAGDFNEAFVSFGERANMNFSLMQVVPLSVLQGKETRGQDRVPASQPVDVGVWYDISGKEVLQTLVADLDSRGHSKLVIKENGDICIDQEDREVVQDTLRNMPDPVNWPLLAKVLGKEGLYASVEDTGIIVAW